MAYCVLRIQTRNTQYVLFHASRFTYLDLKIFWRELQIEVQLEQ
jgi:hypothetical protein